MIRKMILVTGYLVSVSSLASAGTIETTCKNPRRSYLVEFDDGAKTFRLHVNGADSVYKVERVEKRENGLVVYGRTVKTGPNFVAYLTDRKRIEFVDGGRIIQTDPCK